MDSKEAEKRIGKLEKRVDELKIRLTKLEKSAKPEKRKRKVKEEAELPEAVEAAS